MEKEYLKIIKDNNLTTVDLFKMREMLLGRDKTINDQDVLDICLRFFQGQKVISGDIHKKLKEKGMFIAKNKLGFILRRHFTLLKAVKNKTTGGKTKAFYLIELKY